MRTAQVVVLAFALVATSARAHDFWIQPGSWHAKPGDRVALDLAVGESCEGELRRRDPGHIESFVITGPGGLQPVTGEAGARPAGNAVLAEEGVHVAAYRSRPRLVTMPADEFDAYLAAEGNEDIVAWRAENGEEDAPGRERYSRYAKAILVAGDATMGGTATARLGWPLELVPLVEPAEFAATTVLPVLLLRQGRPLRDHLVVGIFCDGAERVVEATTDDQGIASLKLSLSGQWLLKSVQVERAAPGKDAEWESSWASLGIDVPDVRLTPDPERPDRAKPRESMPR